VVNHVLNELHVSCLPDDLPEYIEVDLSNLAVGKSVHVRDLKLAKGVEFSLHKDENPVVATVVVPALIVEEEVAAPVVSAADVPTTEQAAPAKEGEGAEGDKGGKTGGDKAAAKPGASDKGGDKKDKK
jgi:large subunit ribosomal protein L25